MLPDINIILDNAKELREFFQNAGSLGPVLMIIFQALQIVFAPLPGEFTGVVAGYIFGTFAGFVYSSVGLSIGSMMSFFISRHFRPRIRPILKKSKLYEKFEFLMVHQGIFVIMILFLFPGFPKDFLCYILGLTRLPWQAFFLIATFCRMPGTLMLTLQGDNIYKGDFIEVSMLFMLILIIMYVLWLKKDTLYLWMETHNGANNNNKKGCE
jgi:uncharacterized membrane protein YdjX (TVP38/TMEM64 family)